MKLKTVKELDTLSAFQQKQMLLYLWNHIFKEKDFSDSDFENDKENKIPNNLKQHFKEK